MAGVRAEYWRESRAVDNGQIDLDQQDKVQEVYFYGPTQG